MFHSVPFGKPAQHIVYAAQHGSAYKPLPRTLGFMGVLDVSIEILERGTNI